MTVNIAKTTTLQTLTIKSIIAHTVTYFFVGLVASTIFQYGELFSQPDVATMMRSIDDPMVMAGPLFQPIRGLIFALAIFPICNAIFDKKYGWAILWWLLVALGILSTFSPAPGSIEGVIYTRYDFGYHFSGGMLEVLTQSLLFSVILHYWVNHSDNRWLNRGLVVAFVLVILLPALGLLALFSGMP